ncbi:hypothetical protein [Granulicella tundricola]|uniref:Uncharacterized protein n=1 Tax=Granulicella tundricola (strain ATCC BAA-1859 / DSM 23138 / MP5ACTX9) TaxID=1198114 RepID=E8X7P2_GRATM|nr:hypothetical protein [Granulicella tundricola]ADW71476.1 hypothetical protein AciX9_4539 [Granulicella tundricola MP5ACTX9]
MNYTQDTYELEITPTILPVRIPYLGYISYSIQGSDPANTGKSFLENTGNFTEVFSRIMPRPEVIGLLDQLKQGRAVHLQAVTFAQLVRLQFNFRALDPDYMAAAQPRGW